MKINAKQRQFLQARGLAANATDAEVKAYVEGLDARARAEFDQLATQGGDGNGQQQGQDGQAAQGRQQAGDRGNQDGDDDPDPGSAPGSASGSAAASATPPSNGQGGAGANSATDAVQAALAADRKRRRDIRAMAAQVHMPMAQVEEHLEGETTIEEFNRIALAYAGARLGDSVGSGQPHRHASSARVTGMHDRNRDTIAQAVEDAICLRAGFPLVETDDDGYVVADEHGRARVRQPVERAQQFRGRDLAETARLFMTQLAPNDSRISGMPRQMIAQAAFVPSQFGLQLGGFAMDTMVAGGHTTSDFPNILQNIATKTLRRAYMEATQRWQAFCRRVTVPDFKTISRVQLGEVPALGEVKENEEIREVTLGDAKETYFARVFARIFSISWQTMVNDDLDALTRIPSNMGVAAQRNRDYLAFNILTSNPLMADGYALFSAQHGNLASGSGNVGVPSVSLLNVAYAAMGTQEGLTDDDDQPIYVDVEPTTILVPKALRGTTAELLTSTNKPGANNNTRNIWENQLSLLSDPILDADSTTAWYLAADYNRVDTIEMAFLEGMNQPMVTMDEGFNTLNRRYRVVDAAEAKAIDHRGLYKNPGS